ncbi:unnamed protein product [Rhizophagus irregularis]|nr:unnamed protein product [Rhizophagus irregularis]
MPAETYNAGHKSRGGGNFLWRYWGKFVKGNTLANAFPVHIDSDQLVGDLKEAIKDKIDVPAGFKAKDLKLWNVSIPDDQDDLLRNLTLNDGDELLATREIATIVERLEPPVSTVTSSREEELFDQVASLQALLNKSVHAFDVVVSSKRTKSFKWTVNIEHATLDGLKNSIRAMNKIPALENDGARRHRSPSTRTFPKVCELYGLSDDPNPSIDVYPVFSCGSADTKNEKYKEALRKLFDELETRVATTPIDVSYEATKSIYLYTYLVSATYPFKDQVKVVPEKLIEGKNGRGNLDYGIESRTTGRIIGLVEVKKDDFKQGFAQATVQLESSLGRKRKANEIG